MSNKIDGVVEHVGEKFNGSVKVGGTYYNFGKGVDKKDVKVGDMVTLKLKEWEFKGKTGKNIAEIDILAGAPPSEVKPAGAKALAELDSVRIKLSGRDFDKEARGKTRCSLFAAALQSPALASLVSDTEGLINEAKKISDEGVKYTFND